MPEILPFKEIFSNKIFRIPDYQRGYSWEESQLEDLWADLTNIHLANNAYHFTGILTINNFSDDDFENLAKEGFSNAIDRQEKIVRLNDEEFKAYNLVDGQQRLTTILILLAQLNDKLKHAAEKLQVSRKYFFRYEEGNKYLFGYHVDVPSHNYLIHNIFEDSSYDPEKTETLYTHNLDFAKKFFHGKLLGYTLNNIRDMITKITERLLFSVLNLSEAAGTNLDISMVFETLNFRGKQLSGLERFKNRVLYLLSKQNITPANMVNRRAQINDTWLEIYKWLGCNPKKVMDDDAFLKAFWLLYFSRDTMVAKDFKSYQQHLFEKDFNLLQIHNNSYMNPVQLPRWLKSMKQAVALWYFINNPFEVDNNPNFCYHYTPGIQRSLLRLNNFPSGYGKYMLNLVLAILMRLLPKKVDGQSITAGDVQNVKNVEKFLWAAERHNIMCFLLNGNKTNYNQEATFRDINRYFQTGNTTQAGSSLIDQLTDHRVSHFNWTAVQRNLALGNYFYAWDGIYFIMREYEEHRSGKMVGKDITINRIYPEELPSIRILYSDINRFGVAKKRKYSYALGNIYMSNNTHAHREFPEHKTRIKTAIRNNNTIYESEKELLDYRSWNTKNVEERSRRILGMMVDKWELPAPEEAFWKEYFAG